ncbi:TauD/TfdA dioxygenase family protein [Herbaspirillum autotrophicum]|uniref:TauD/TfdA dioxygenase family protein n=1 Tax=Herbaspirillum autotrophicum TaxID=180195 RepID=UPI00067DC59F|nr:TauD/TfdA family dioxygenase [Herbaspirillum autotrophicum]
MSDQLQSAPAPHDAQFQRIEVIPSAGLIGADIRIPDVRLLDAATAQELRQAWLKYEVIRIRGQQLNEDEQITFGRWFGEFQISNPLPSPVTRADLPGIGRPGEVTQAPRAALYPQFTYVSNVIEQGLALGGLGDGELVWHSDMSSFEAPPSATILYAIEVPPTGGRTFFASAVRATAELPASKLEQLAALALKHDKIIDAAGYLRPGAQAVQDVSISPGHLHPLLIRHPETGHPALYLGRRPYAWLSGLAVMQSEALLDELWAHVTQEKFQWVQQWQAGDILIWDNRSLLHRREAFASTDRRLLRRLVIRGEAVIPYQQTDHAAVAA